MKSWLGFSDVYQHVQVSGSRVAWFSENCGAGGAAQWLSAGLACTMIAHGLDLQSHICARAYPPHDGSPTTQLLYELRAVPMQPGRAQGSLQEGIRSQDHRLPGMVSWGGQQKQLPESVHRRLKVAQLASQKKKKKGGTRTQVSQVLGLCVFSHLKIFPHLHCHWRVSRSLQTRLDNITAFLQKAPSPLSCEH